MVFRSYSFRDYNYGQQIRRTRGYQGTLYLCYCCGGGYVGGWGWGWRVVGV